MVLEGESVITEKGLGDLIILGLSRVDRKLAGKIKNETTENNLPQVARRKNKNS